MKKIILPLLLCFSAATPLFADGTNVLSDEKSRVSYALGMYFGHGWQQQGIDVDFDLFLRGLKDAKAGAPTLLTPQEMRETLTTYQQELRAKEQKSRDELAAKNAALAGQNEKEAEAFLATNKLNPGVVTLPDGLQYKVISDGNGPKPANGDTVTVNYRGTLLDGSEFDSSYKRGQPAQFELGRVIPGWNEALTQMKTGSTWQLFIPPQLAYGPQSQGGIPPNSLLIFQVELLSVQHPQPPPPVAAAAPLTSDIIAVPSAEEIKKGRKPYTIKAEDLPKAQSQLQQTN